MQSIKKVMLTKACLKSLEVLTSMVTPQALLAEITAQCICSMSLFSLNNDFLWKSFINLLKLGPMPGGGPRLDCWARIQFGAGTFREKT